MRLYSAKETYNLIDPTNRSHPIWWIHTWNMTHSCVCYITDVRVRHDSSCSDLTPGRGCDGTWHIWMSHVTHTNESCQTYESVTSHVWMSYVTHMNESCGTYECVLHMCHFTYSSWTPGRGHDVCHMCDVTHWYVSLMNELRRRHDTWLIVMYRFTPVSYVWRVPHS